MNDRFANLAPSLTSPAISGFAVTPDDAAPLPEMSRAIYVGGTGDLCVIMSSGDELVFTAVAAGSWLPIRAAAVKATGTTATGLVGLV